MKIPISRETLESKPDEVWNKFVEIVALSSHSELDLQQRPAHFAFSCDSEVQNGGHFQYFANQGLEGVPDTIEALRVLGAHTQSEVLTAAYQVAQELDWDSISDSESYGAREKAASLGKFDRLYYNCSPTITEILERHLCQNARLYFNVDSD